LIIIDNAIGLKLTFKKSNQYSGELAPTNSVVAFANKRLSEKWFKHLERVSRKHALMLF